MSSHRPLSDDELKGILDRVARLGDRGWRQQPLIRHSPRLLSMRS